jgi:hypothetical protein
MVGNSWSERNAIEAWKSYKTSTTQVKTTNNSEQNYSHSLFSEEAKEFLRKYWEKEALRKLEEKLKKEKEIWGDYIENLEWAKRCYKLKPDEKKHGKIQRPIPIKYQDIEKEPNWLDILGHYELNCFGWYVENTLDGYHIAKREERLSWSGREYENGLDRVTPGDQTTVFSAWYPHQILSNYMMVWSVITQLPFVRIEKKGDRLEIDYQPFMYKDEVYECKFPNYFLKKHSFFLNEASYFNPAGEIRHCKKLKEFLERMHGEPIDDNMIETTEKDIKIHVLNKLASLELELVQIAVEERWWRGKGLGTRKGNLPFPESMEPLKFSRGIYYGIDYPDTVFGNWGGGGGSGSG